VNSNGSSAFTPRPLVLAIRGLSGPQAAHCLSHFTDCCQNFQTHSKKEVDIDGDLGD
jgi:hypothetical protein